MPLVVAAPARQVILSGGFTKVVQDESWLVRRFVQTDPDLRRVIDAWPMLPRHIKAAIVALLDAVP
jgi:hypothetical protein